MRDARVMAATRRAPLPQGRQPWDPVNGLRIGALAGALVGAAAGALFGFLELWVIAVTAAGGAIGWRSEKRKQSRHEHPTNDGRRAR